MSVLIDPPLWPNHDTMWSHLVSDASLDELHEFARRAALPARSFDLDHYDVPQRDHDRLVSLGAHPVTANELVRRLIGSGLRVRHVERVELFVAGGWQNPVMPELPEVEALARDLGGRLTGRVIDRLEIVAFAALKTFDPPVSALAGARILGVGRRGKFLDVDTSTPDAPLHLIVHLARAGWVRWREQPPPPRTRPGAGPLAARLVLAGDDEHTADEHTGDERIGGGRTGGDGFDLTEAGTKKSLAVWVVHDPADVPGVARLGPDPLAEEFTVATLARILRSNGRAQLKGVLRSQSNIAGIGNAYSDEILHVAKMSPYKPADMPPGDVERLYEAMQTTLRDALARNEGVPASMLKGEKKSNMRVHGRTGEACPVCGDTVREVIFADSTFQYCPTCQTGGKPLADRVLSRLLK